MAHFFQSYGQVDNLFEQFTFNKVNSFRLKKLLLFMIDIVVDIEVKYRTFVRRKSNFICIVLGFGFVTFADMTTTKTVCSTRIFNLHGRKVLLD